MTAPVTVAVIAQRGGAALARTLAATQWAAERVVVDAGDVARELPPGVRRVPPTVDVGAAAASPWVLLLADDEQPDDGLAAAVAAAAGGAPAAWRLPRALDALGLGFRLHHAPVRLAPRPAARLRLGAGLALDLAAPAPRARRLAAGVHVDRAATLDAALPALDADARALAALLVASGASPRTHRLATSFAAGAADVLAAAATAATSWRGRWIVAVLTGYRGLVAQAKLWELAHAQRPELG